MDILKNAIKKIDFLDLYAKSVIVIISINTFYLGRKIVPVIVNLMGIKIDTVTLIMALSIWILCIVSIGTKVVKHIMSKINANL